MVEKVIKIKRGAKLTNCDECGDIFKKKDVRIMVMEKTPNKSLSGYSLKVMGRYHRKCYDKLFSGKLKYENEA